MKITHVNSRNIFLINKQHPKSKKLLKTDVVATENNKDISRRRLGGGDTRERKEGAQTRGKALPSPPVSLNAALFLCLRPD